MSKKPVRLRGPRLPDAPFQGPARKAPEFYAGETYGPNTIQYPDVERYPNGALPSKRNKFARRIIRSAFKARFSSLTKPLRLARGLRAQAYEVAKDDQPKTAKRGRWARRLLAKELAIHQPVYAPSGPELRKMRTQRRKELRAGKKDAISQLVDAMAERRP